MSLQVKTAREYFGVVVGAIDKLGIVRDRSMLTYKPVNKTEGRIAAPASGGFAKPGDPPSGLIFVDGAFLRFEELARVQPNGSVELIRYSYHYQRHDVYYFRFDKLERPFSDPIKNILEPLQHLQVIRPAPRFPTHSTNLREVLALIRYNFY